MPRCLMAKKWKAYPWPDRAEEQPVAGAEQELDTTTATTTHTTSSSSAASANGSDATCSTPATVAPESSPPQSTPATTGELVEEDEEIDVVGDSPAAATATAASSKSTTAGSTVAVATCWGPSSPTAGATAPSPPPHSPEAATRESTILYNVPLGPPSKRNRVLIFCPSCGRAAAGGGWLIFINTHSGGGTDGPSLSLGSADFEKILYACVGGFVKEKMSDAGSFPFTFGQGRIHLHPPSNPSGIVNKIRSGSGCTTDPLAPRTTREQTSVRTR
uniref:Uncharacterized protein n=1 Tax=Anopheles farauti TaxID=69004 RepID=A0A182QR48_9DIPT